MSSKKISSKMIAQMSKQSLKSSRMRNIFVMITIVLASALLMAILMYAVGQRETNERQLSHAQQVSYYNLTDSQVETLKNDERIAYQIQMKSGTTSKVGNISITPTYVSELSDEIRVEEMEKGNLPQKENEIAVQGAMLEKMGIEPKVGSKVTLDFYDGNTETFIVTGILKGGETSKQYRVFFSQSYAENGSQLKNSSYEVYAKLYGATTMHPEDCTELMYLIGNDAGIERKNVNPFKSFIDSLSTDLQDVMVYGLVGIIILLACILVIYGVFYLSVIGKIHQFGQLRTIGMTRKQMKKLVSKEGRRLFLYASPIGILIGGIAGYFIIPSGFSVINTLLMAVCVFAIVYIITMISVHKPAKLAAAVSPMEALRYVPQDGMEKAANKKMCRSLTPLGLGMMNFSKNKKKAVVTMLSLSLGGILFMTATTFMSSFDKEKYVREGIWENAEFHIQYSVSAIELAENGASDLQAQAPLDQTFMDEITAIDGVKNIQTIKNMGIKYSYPQFDEYNTNDNIFLLTEAQSKEVAKYLESGSADYDKLMSGNYVLISQNDVVEEIYGWKFNTGDILTFRYFDGTNSIEKEVEVLGILNQQFKMDYDLIEGWFVMPEQAVLPWLSYDSLASDVLVSTEPDKESFVSESLQQIIDTRPELEMETLADQRITSAQVVNRQFSTISGLAVFIMAFSILSMMNTLITNIATRKQELAMLESIGMTKRQIRWMLLGESLVLVFVAICVTMTLGTLLGYSIVTLLHNRGMAHFIFKFPLAFALAYAVVLIAVPLVITLVTLKSFSKEALVERLRGAEC